MNSSHLIGGIVIVFFGILEIVKHHLSDLGFILIFLGVLIIFIQFFRWRSEHLEDFDNDDYSDFSGSNFSDGGAD